ncbi:MAG: asparagine synthase (glutamine-hydrolyzing), partial [Frankiaceae bacterium]|nr:asparagine synthase (glutamine-hydrolyzing) [Arenimonas sp.]
DLSPAGHQPMSSDDGDWTIVFNGEIYNFVELRDELQALGHRFRSHGDTEVLLAAYRQWGADCLLRLNGMWAFVIHDRRRGLLFGARDRFGIKPLFRWQQGAQAILASEIKAIRSSGLFRGGLDLRTCADHLYEGRLDETDATFFEGIVQVPAGHAFELKLDGSYRQWAYFNALSAPPVSEAEPAATFADLFEDAVRVHMRSDVPVGVNLSGGLDSTSILCAAARVREAGNATGQLLAFCYQDKAFDESRYIRDTLAQTGAQLVPLNITPLQLWDSLPGMLAVQDEPVHSMTALVGYHLMALAASHGVKVILNGQGADEILGGYGSYFHDRWAELIRAGRWQHARDEIAQYNEAHGGDAGGRFSRALRHVLQSGFQALPLYRALAARQRSRRHASATWLRPELARHATQAAVQTPPGLRAVLGDALRRAPLPLYLRVEDRNSMAHSVEVRLPFLDHRLVALAFGLGSEWKLRGPWNKYVLREAMRARIPESVRSRVDKMGFPTDMAQWFRGTLYQPLREVLNDPGFRQNPLFDANALAADLEAHRSGRVNHADRLFATAQFHLWQQGLGAPANDSPSHGT